jgi:hypothetical protein
MVQRPVKTCGAAAFPSVERQKEGVKSERYAISNGWIPDQKEEIRLKTEIWRNNGHS